MEERKYNIGFMGAGGIARAHAFSLNSLKYYYADAPPLVFYAVTSARQESRESFAGKYGFNKALDFETFIKNDAIDLVFILGPNKVHYPHLEAALKMPSVKRIYLEKPVCSTFEEEEKIRILKASYPEKITQVGFQFLQAAAIREAYAFWNSGVLGKPIHFEVKYYHADYLMKPYREKRASRLTPAPDGGAMADLGSHAISLLLAFLGNDADITHALQAGGFPDVPVDSDLFSSLSLRYPVSGVAGTLSASRISAGTGDLFAFDFFAEKGALRYSSHYPDYFEYYLENDGQWHRHYVGSNYPGITSFPSGHVPPGWLQSMIHAHYLFLNGQDEKAFVPDIDHGLAVQRIVRETAEYLTKYRSHQKL